MLKQHHLSSRKSITFTLHLFIYPMLLSKVTYGAFRLYIFFPTFLFSVCCYYLKIIVVLACMWLRLKQVKKMQTGWATAETVRLLMASLYCVECVGNNELNCLCCSWTLGCFLHVCLSWPRWPASSPTFPHCYRWMLYIQYVVILCTIQTLVLFSFV